MLSVDDVIATPEVGDGMPTMLLSRRSSVASDRPSVTLTRCESFRGSSSSLTQGGPAAATSSRRRESIVETLDKKCRENVSSRLRNQLPEHLRRSSTTMADLPVIVRPPSRQSLTSAALPRTSRRGSTQLYQGVTSGGVAPLQSAGRRHSTTAAGSTLPRWGKSLSQYPPVDLDDLLDYSAPSSAWSTLERPRTDPDATWTEGKWSTLPTRLVPNFDSMEDQSPCGYSYTGSTSSAETFSEDIAKTDFDEHADSDDDDGCDEVSVESFTFSPSISEGRLLDAPSDVFLGHDKSIGTEQTSKTVPVVDVEHKTSPRTQHFELQLTKPSEALVNNALNNRRAATTQAMKSGPLTSRPTDIRLTNGNASRAAVEITELHHNSERLEPELFRSTTELVSDPSRVQQNGQQKPLEYIGHVPQPSRHSQREGDARTEVGAQTTPPTVRDDRPRYRTTISLSLSSTQPSASTCRQSCQLTPSQKPTVDEDFENNSPPPPPLPLSVQPELVDSRSFLDDWTEDFIDKDSVCVRQQTTESVRRDDNDGGQTGRGDGSTAGLRNETICSEDPVLISSKQQFNVTTATRHAASTNCSSVGVTTSGHQTVSSHTIISASQTTRIAKQLPTNSSTKPVDRCNNGSAATDKNFLIDDFEGVGNQKLHKDDMRLNDIELFGTRSESTTTTPRHGNKNTAAALQYDLMNGEPVSVMVVGQNGLARSHFDGQVNGFHAPPRDQGPLKHDSDVQHLSNNRRQTETPEQPGWCRRTESAQTSSRDRKSGHLTSGSAAVNVVETRSTTRATLIPVRVQGQPSAGKPLATVSDQTGPSVDRTWEILRTDRTRTEVVPPRTTKNPAGPLATRPPEPRHDDSSRRPVVVVPVKHCATTRRRFSGSSDGTRSLVTRSNSLDASPPAERLHSSFQWDHVLDTRILDVDVVKSGLALGFSIDGGRDSLFGDRPLTVKRIFREDERQLKPGDEILSANGRPVTDLSHFVALNFLKSLPDGLVHLVLRRQIVN